MAKFEQGPKLTPENQATFNRLAEMDAFIGKDENRSFHAKKRGTIDKPFILIFMGFQGRLQSAIAQVSLNAELLPETLSKLEEDFKTIKEKIGYE